MRYHNSTFLLVRSTLRTALLCSLLVFGHVLLTTLAVAPRDLIETFPDISSSAKRLSAVTFLTLLWQIFVLIEQSDCLIPAFNPTIASLMLRRIVSHTNPAAVAAAGSWSSGTSNQVDIVTEKVALEVSQVENGEEEEYDAVVVFGSTACEGVMGLFATAVWAYFLSDAITLFTIFTPGLAPELCILPITYALAALSLLSLNAQLFFHLAAGMQTGRVSGSWWSARTGCWESRIMLGETGQQQV